MKSKTIHKKYVIIGAGPGGLQMGYFFEKAKQDYIILERSNVPGSFYTKFPIHRKLISINKKYNFFKEEEFNMRHDWNSLLCDNPSLKFTNYSDDLFPNADTLVKYVNDFQKENQINVRFNTTVLKIKKENDLFFIQTSDEEFSCEVLLMATGPVSEVTPSEIEGIENTTPYSQQSMDLNFYKNKRVAVLGGGNSAFETADYLSQTAAFVHVMVKHPIKMAWETHFVGDVRAVNNNIFDLYQLKSLHAVLRPKIKKIEKLPGGTLKTHHQYDYPNSNPPGSLELTREYDVIINCTGFNWINLSLFDESIIPETKQNNKYPLLNENWESLNVNNLFFIGGAMQSIDRKSSSGFIHGFRYNIKSLHNILSHRYEGLELNQISFSSFDEKVFFENLYKRVTLSTSLFQLYGFLGDMITFSKDLKGSYKIHPELPVNYIKKMIPADQHVLILTLEFGFHKQDKSALTFLGPSDPNDTENAVFIHPVIRHFYKNTTSEFHFGDSLLARWDAPHEAGGPVMSYQIEFMNWIKETIGLNFTVPLFNQPSNYREWTDEEINLYHKNK